MPVDTAVISAAALKKYKELAEKYPGHLTQEQVSEVKKALRDIVSQGRYTGPLGVFTTTGFHTSKEQPSFEDIQIRFFPIQGGEEILMPIANCLTFYSIVYLEM